MPERERYKISVIIEPDGPGFYAHCPALKGLHTYGDTEKEALDNATNAIIAYIKSLKKHGDPIPIGIIEREKPKIEISFPKLHTKSHTEELTVAVS